ncbi:unnamed protein product [Rotaria magnacalcarata]|uniref:Uncharacterized protein n=1 Tax=Rotaria magnacalcarata TaxID=392030 RepID=A0A817AG21_9BILA|nr:unnamed protein product [Rotaria magnacalcarata]CAF1671922.1 unnamed protein product [Rotaria magnacalcarata]CAF2258628.1 unnamed protein product [Rotaria magnacalcarata]CAF5120997.1 unnamed protein product [Rotaria magnacalcarata]
MHYNALKRQKIINYNALGHVFFQIMENNGSFFHYLSIIGYMVIFNLKAFSAITKDYIDRCEASTTTNQERIYNGPISNQPSFTINSPLNTIHNSLATEYLLTAFRKNKAFLKSWTIILPMNTKNPSQPHTQQQQLTPSIATNFSYWSIRVSFLAINIPTIPTQSISTSLSSN